MLVAKKEMFWFIEGPVAKIRAIRDTALPAFTKLFYFYKNFIFEFIFLLRDNLLAEDHEASQPETCSMDKP